MTEAESTATPNRSRAILKFVLATIVGAFFFLIPVRVGGQWTIPFDVIVSYIREDFPGAVALYSLLAILSSVVLTIVAELQARGMLGVERFDAGYFRTGPAFLFFRILGGVFVIMIFFQIGPEIMLAENTGGLMFNTLVASVAVIVPIGAVFITLFTAFGGLEFIGTLARPVMAPCSGSPGGER